MVQQTSSGQPGIAARNATITIGSSNVTGVVGMNGFGGINFGGNKSNNA